MNGFALKKVNKTSGLVMFQQSIKEFKEMKGHAKLKLMEKRVKAQNKELTARVEFE